MRAATYTFTSVWRISACRERTWTFLESPDQQWADWWPPLRSIHLHRTDQLLGSTASCRWRSLWGYVLGVDLEVVRVERGHRVDLAADGDLTGTGVVRFADGSDGTTEVTTQWSVTTTPRWMQISSPVLWPMFRIGHYVVMRRGERGLERALTRRRREWHGPSGRT